MAVLHWSDLKHFYHPILYLSRLRNGIAYTQIHKRCSKKCTFIARLTCDKIFGVLTFRVNEIYCCSVTWFEFLVTHSVDIHLKNFIVSSIFKVRTIFLGSIYIHSFTMAWVLRKFYQAHITDLDISHNDRNDSHSDMFVHVFIIIRFYRITARSSQVFL